MSLVYSGNRYRSHYNSKMPRRCITVNELIANLHEYFLKERENGGPLCDVKQKQKRVVKLS